MAFEDVSAQAPALPFYFRQFLSGPHENFHYVIGDPASRRAAIIDPAFNLDRIFMAVEDDGYEIREAWFTHGHWDHIGGIPEVFDLGVQTVRIHRAANDHAKIVEAGDRAALFDDGDVLSVGGIDIEALHTPGHQPESSCFLTRSDPPALFGGDTLFIGSCGRTDFPGGDTEATFRTMGRLRALSDDAVVFPGHDYADRPWQRLGVEKETNPALATLDREAFGKLHCLSN